MVREPGNDAGSLLRAAFGVPAGAVGSAPCGAAQTCLAHSVATVLAAAVADLARIEYAVSAYRLLAAFRLVVYAALGIACDCRRLVRSVREERSAGERLGRS